MNLADFFIRNRHQIQLHAIIFLWGFTGILGKLISISSMSIVWWRMLIGFIGLLIFILSTGRSLNTSKINIIKYLGTGIVTAAHWILFFEALKVSNVSITLTTLASTTLFVAFIEPLFFKRKIWGYEVVLGLCTLIGLAIIFGAETEYSLGIGLALGSAFLAATFGTINGVFVKTDRPTVITTYEMLGGTMGITIYSLFQPNIFILPAGLDWVWLLILGLVCTSLAFVVSIEVMKSLSPFTVSISINMEPIYAIAFALIIFREDEYMSPLFYVGALIVMGMIFLNGVIKRRRNRRSSTVPSSSAR